MVNLGDRLAYEVAWMVESKKISMDSDLFDVLLLYLEINEVSDVFLWMREYEIHSGYRKNG